MHLSVCLYVKGFIGEESFKDHERGKEFESSRESYESSGESSRGSLGERLRELKWELKQELSS